MSAAPGRARVAWDELLFALSGRFGPAEREPRFALLRPKLARAALVPSRLYDDDASWTRSDGPLREVQFWGEPKGAAGYRIAVAQQPPPPARPGEYRGRLQLERLAPGEFRWRTSDTLALGSLTRAELERAADALLRLAEQTPEGDARAAVRGSLPHAAAALGRLLSLDRLELRSAAGGGRAVALDATLHPEWLAAALPGYASFLRRYVSSLSTSLGVEEAGSEFLAASLSGGQMALRLRVHEGGLAPLEGPPRPLAGRCRARFAITLKRGMFRYGFEGLQGDVELLDGPGSAGFRASFRQEPDWRIPFLVEPLLRGPLGRPFQDEGALLSYLLSDPPPGSSSTSVTRDYRLAVKESWIVRWLAGNVGSAVLDFRRGAEAEADRFAREVLLALRADVRALLAGGGARDPAAPVLDALRIRGVACPRGCRPERGAR